MNNFLKNGSFAACVLGFSALPLEASAGEWRWSTVNQIVAGAAVSHDTTVWALDANDSVLGQGLRIRRRNVSFVNWEPPASNDGRGTSLAIDASDLRLYAVALDNRVWFKFQGTTWMSIPNNRCEGGTMAIRQTVGDNNLAATHGQVYVISGTRTRWWNGSCWSQMPALPTGSPVDIAPSPDDPYKIWAVNGSNQIFKWTDSGWVTVTTGLASSLGYDWVAGANPASVWRYVPNGTFTQVDSWNNGTIRQISNIDGSNSKVAVTSNGTLWWYGYHF